MIALLSPWLLLLLGLCSIFTIHPWERAAYVLLVLVIGPFLEWILPLENSRRVGGLTGVTLALIIPVPVIDRLALVVAVATCQAFPYTIHRPMVVSMGLMVASGPVTSSLFYNAISTLYTAILASWLYERRHGKSSKSVKRRLFVGVFYLIAVSVLALATAALLPLAHEWMVQQAVGPAFMKRAGFGVVTNLRGITSIQSSSAITLRMWATGPRLLRGQIYSTYGNGLWNASGSAPFTFIADYDKDLPIPKSKDIERVERTSRYSRFVFMPRNGQPRVVKGCRVERNRHGTMFSTTNAVVSYAYALPNGATISQSPGPRTTPGEYLALPQALKGALKRMAEKHGKGKNDKQKVYSLAAHLNSKYAYSLSPNTPRYGQDPVLWFLQERKEGHCELFASALVLLARSLNIPARYVSGYSVSTRNPFTDYYVGRNCDAHAWCEIWLENEGWVDVDPTPPDWRGSQTTSSVLFMRNLTDGVRYWLADLVTQTIEELSATFDETNKTAIMLFFVTALSIYFIWQRRAWFTGSWTSALSPLLEEEISQAQLSFYKFEALFRLLGVRRLQNETAEEFLVSVDQSVGQQEIKELARQFVSIFEKTRYGLEQWPHDEASELLDELKKAIDTHSK